MVAQVQQAVVRCQIIGVCGHAAPREVVSARYQYRARLAQHPGHVGFGHHIRVAYGQIKTLVGKVDKAVGQFQFDMNVRELL